MNKYASYSVRAFVGDDGFINWVLSPDEESARFWASFLKEYPFQKENIEQARQAVLTLKEVAADQVAEESVTEMWSEFQAAVSPGRPKPFYRRKWGQISSVAAAVMLLMSGWFWGRADFYPGKEGSLENKGSNTIVLENISEVEATYNLPDSSIVVLKPGSRLTYPDGFTGQVRTVSLSGEAFFDVLPDKDKPFLVYATDLTVKVLGTSFLVRAREDSVTVAVKTGRVSVVRHRRDLFTVKDETVVLAPNEQVAFQTGTKGFDKSIVSAPMPVLDESALQSFTFRSQQVSTIFEAMENAYGIEITYNAELMANCRLTTSLGKESLFEKLDVICTAINATYRKEGTRIVVDGKSCL